MNEIISIIKSDSPTSHKVIIGDNTLSLVNSLKIDEQSKGTLIDEAINILRHCISPNVNDSITNIAVGYVQSGKTMSFTTLSALAADNNYKIIIYFTGTKTNLLGQTVRRLKMDLKTQSFDSHYQIFDEAVDVNNFPEINRVKNFIKRDGMVLLFPILKHYLHINRLANVFTSPYIQPLISNRGVLIIDDEADQSSFNTFAKKNSGKEDWEEDEYSRTYASILNLKKSLPNHSYIQYTATPQAAFLIDNSDFLSPKYHTVLTPGKGYTGGKFFFKNQEMNLIREIPEDEVYHYKRNPLTDRPSSLISALRQFVLSVGIVVYKQHRKDFLSMMVHPDGLKESNEKFAIWITNTIQQWINVFEENISTYVEMLKSDFLKDYEDIAIYVHDCPSFDTVFDNLYDILLRVHIHLIQGDAEKDVDWSTSPAHILVGADMLNRGFTVENLSITYMPRSSKGKATADTIEQRCRFFGYKMPYIDVCRLFLPIKSITEYNDYVEHEEVLRANLKQYETLAEFSKNAKAMVLADSLNPTRTNILSQKLIKDKLYGWRQMLSSDCMEPNKVVISKFLSEISSQTTLFHDYEGNPNRNHRFAKIDIDRFIDFFKDVKYLDVPNITRKIVTIQYLSYLKEKENLKFVYVFEMAYGVDSLQERKLNPDGKPNNLQMGHAKNGSYPGDREIKFEDSICVQIYHIELKDSLLRAEFHKKDLYNLAIYYPQSLGTSFVSTDTTDEDE